MAKLIEASGLLEQVVRIQASEQAPEKKVGQIIMAITNAPVVDAVEVIRCESCKWYEPECENCDFWGGYRNPDHYCGEGERKNEAG